MRYSKQIALPEIGVKGQQKLFESRVLVIGAGGLGCPVLQYLTAAGVGTIGIVDGDVIDETNLHRQVLYNPQEVGQKKVDVAKKKLETQNPEVDITVFDSYINSNNAIELVENYDVVVDATDSLAARYLINDVCVKLDKPLVYGAIHKFEGQVSVFNYQDGPTYRCLFPFQDNETQLQTCNDSGVIGMLPSVIGTYQATEVVKVILGIGEPLRGKLLTLNLLHNSNTIFQFQRSEEQIQIAKEICLAEHKLQTEKPQSIDADSLLAWTETGKAFQIIDVRALNEQPRLEFSNVIEAPLDKIKSFSNSIDKSLPTVVVCQYGKRSLNAIEILKSDFQAPLYNLKNGVSAIQKHRI